MEISHTEFPQYDLIKIIGRIDSYTAPSLSDKLKTIIISGRYNLILDLQDVTYVSSAGLRVMIDVQKTCRRDGRGETILLHPSQRIYETLEVTGFLPLFKLFTDTDSALCYFP